MIIFGYIGKEEEDKHLYFTFVEDRLRIQEFEGAEGPMKRKLISLKCSTILILFEQFLMVDREIVDIGKNVHIYEETRKRIQAYIHWGHENEKIAPESVIDNGLISVKYMTRMIDMISKEHPSRKELIFLRHGVEVNYKVEYNI